MNKFFKWILAILGTVGSIVITVLSLGLGKSKEEKKIKKLIKDGKKEEEKVVKKIEELKENKTKNKKELKNLEKEMKEIKKDVGKMEDVFKKGNEEDAADFLRRFSKGK
jgi:seryl-tRNA synthetase